MPYATPFKAASSMTICQSSLGMPDQLSASTYPHGNATRRLFPLGRVASVGVPICQTHSNGLV